MSCCTVLPIFLHSSVCIHWCTMTHELLHRLPHVLYQAACLGLDGRVQVSAIQATGYVLDKWHGCLKAAWSEGRMVGLCALSCASCCIWSVLMACQQCSRVGVHLCSAAPAPSHHVGSWDVYASSRSALCLLQQDNSWAVHMATKAHDHSS
jgi:hypothetical protein